MRELEQVDRFGIGWRRELGPSIISHLDQIDVVEVIVDDFFCASTKKLQSLKTLGRMVPMVCHGVTLGLASSHLVDERRLDGLARTIGYLEPESWSEHLAFVRAGGIEIGHLAMPPRTNESLEGTCINLQRVEKVVGKGPLLENIASLIDPPGSSLEEGAWVSGILQGSGSELLLDLHNILSNASNFGRDPAEYLETFPLERVRTVHLSGGKWISEPSRFAENGSAKRLLDDHVHDVPEDVFLLLKTLASKVNHPLTVILERDGEYPDFKQLLDQIGAARSAVHAGRVLRGRRREGKHECAGT
jgi:uncharacterized protein (UPF0276 family)